MERGRGGAVRRWLSRTSPVWFAGYAIVAAFATYFCMFGFRKPFAAATFEGSGAAWLDVDLKTALVVSQMCGYALAKWLGIKWCSEATPERRAILLVALIAMAELALVLFGVLPGSWKMLAMFLNGLPLGMVFGLVVWYLEGRRLSEALLAGLCCSFILASGVVKHVGRSFLQRGVTESWMPALVGLCFLLPFLAAVLLLHQLPPPDAADRAARIERRPMGPSERRAFLRRYFPGLALLLFLYVLLTAFRDFRDNYAVELLSELGLADRPAILTQTEVPVALGVLLCLASLGWIRDNRRGLAVLYGVMLLGMALLGASTWLLRTGRVGGVGWMILLGLGSYVVYVPFNSILFDRLMACTRTSGTAVFCIYLADAAGYPVSIAVQLYKDLGQAEASRLEFFQSLTWQLSLVGACCLLLSGAYFLRREAPERPRLRRYDEVP